MATTSWKTVGTAAAVNRTGGAVAWTNPARAVSSNNSYATAALNAQTSHWLWCTNFGFTIADVPAGATIVGIEARWEANQTDPGFGSEGLFGTTVHLIKNHALQGSALTASTHLATTDTVYTFGGASNVWGGTWVAADAISASSGVAFSFHDSDYVPTTVSCDVVELRWHYTEAGGSARKDGAFFGLIT